MLLGFPGAEPLEEERPLLSKYSK